MRTTLRYGAAIGLMASAFGALGAASAYAGQIPGTSTPAGVIQQVRSTDNLQGQPAMQLNPIRHCHTWGYYGHHHAYCRSYYH